MPAAPRLLSLRSFTIPPQLLDAEALRCEPAAVVQLRRGQPVDMEVIARPTASRQVVAPAAGTLTRTAEPWPRVGTWTGASPGPGAQVGATARLGLVMQGASLRPSAAPTQATLERWRPATIQVDGRAALDPNLLLLELPAGWIEAVVVGPGARVERGAPLLRWVGDDGLRARLRLSNADKQRVGDISDADVVILEGKRAPWVESATWQADADGGWLVANLPAGNAAPADGSPGDRVAALLRTGTPQPRLAVPRQSIVQRGVERFVWVRHEGQRFGWHEVALGVDGGDRVEVLLGLVAGDCVIVQGHDVIEAAVAELRSDDSQRTDE